MRVFCAVTFLLVFSTSAFSQIDFQDNFDDGNIDDWERFDLVQFLSGGSGDPHSTISFSDGGLRFQSATTGPELPPGGGAIVRPDLIFSDFELSIDVVEDLASESGSLYGLAARSQGPFFTYVLIAAKTEPSFFPDNVGQTVFSMSRLAGPEVEQFGETFVDVPDDADLRIVFRGEGAALTGELFNLNDLSAPLATLMAEDSTYPFGYAELIASDAIPGDGTRFLDASVDVTFDNFSLVATPVVPEPSSGPMSVFGGLLLVMLVRRRQACA